MKSQIEKYYAKGWLEFGRNDIAGLERLQAAEQYFEEHEACQYGSAPLPDLSQPRVDYTPKNSVPAFLLDFRVKFEKTQKQLTEGQKRVLARVVLNNLAIGVYGATNRHYNHNLELAKECLCRGLDRLVVYYGGKRSKPRIQGKGVGIDLKGWIEEKVK